MTRTMSLAHLTAIDLDPPALIQAAADAGYDAVGLRLLRATATSPGYPLMEDRALMRATRRALTGTGLAVHDIEFVRLAPETAIAALLPFLDAGGELGAREVIAAAYDPDLSRLSDRLGQLSEAAAARGLGVSLEFFPWTDVPDLETALAVADRAGAAIGILCDSLHFDRSGSRPGTLRTVPRERLRFAHLCDAPVCPPYTTEALLHTARVERLPPGDGQIDLAAFLSALPADLPLALEVPMAGRTAREGPAAVIAAALSGARRVLAGLGD